MYPDGTWLCPGQFDRVRLMEMERRMRPVRTGVLLVLGLGVAAVARREGWPAVLLVVSVCALVPFVDRRVAVAARPEYWLFLLNLGGVVAIAAAVALTGGPHSVALPWLVVPVVTSTVMFTARGVAITLVFALLTTVATAAAVDEQALLDAPQHVLATIVLIACVGSFCYGLMRAEVFHRRESVLDPLTGLLNRTTLAQRFEELRQQAVVTGAPIALIEFDLDHFKHVNDTYGHERGDAVLRDVAYELRKSLRSFELVYRVGGEEFLVILPGLDESAATMIAEAVCARVRRSRPGGLEVTLSGGVSSAAGDELAYEQLFEHADARLFQAKAEGRDRVVPPSGRRDAAADLRLTG